MMKSGKQQRLKLQSARASNAATAKKLTGIEISVQQQPAHDFRLKGQSSVSTSVINAHATSSRSAAANALFTVFHVREAAYEVEKRIIESRRPLRAQSLCASSLYHELIDIPTRPPWRRGIKAHRLHADEESMFEAWLDRIYAQYAPTRLNHFEHNLQVWRQLWRVCEMSDVLLLSADARHPMFHCPPSLVHYVTVTLAKPMILVMNKIDLIDQQTLDGWLHWFRRNYPTLTVIPFSSWPHPDSIVSQDVDASKKHKDRKKNGKKPAPAGVTDVMNALHQQLAAKRQRVAALRAAEQAELQETADRRIRQMQQELEEELKSQHADDEEDGIDDTQSELGLSDLIQLTNPSSNVPSSSPSSTLSSSSSRMKAQRASQRDDILVVGTIGHPNAGKSSLINAMFGKPVVSVSETPGHTKHLQSLALTSEIALVDCPGLVFPAVDMPRALQVLCGIFPISQLREPYTSVQYLAERVPLDVVYGLQRPRPLAAVSSHKAARGKGAEEIDAVELLTAQAELDAEHAEWSAWMLCEAYAAQRNFTIKGSNGRLDTNRAANEILHDCLHGNVVLNFIAPQDDEATDAAQHQQFSLST